MRVQNRKLLLMEPNKVELSHDFFNDSPSGPNEVVVKVTSSGICGSDLHYFKNGGLGTFMSSMPMHLGHEAAGIVVTTSDPRFREGDQVAIEPGLTCGSCSYCVDNRSNLCPDVKFLGANAVGAQSDFLRVDSSIAIPFTGIEPRFLALFEPFTVGLHNANLGGKLLNINEPVRIAIIGGGTIGRMIALACYLQFPKAEIFVIEQSPQRRSSARGLLPRSIEILRFLDVTLLKDSPCHLVYDVVGNETTFAVGQQIARTGGVIILVGIPEGDNLDINPHRARVKELTCMFSRRSAVNLALAKTLFQDIQGFITNFTIETFSPEKGAEAYSHSIAWERETQRVQISWLSK
jgi:L-iditol 2-dehydrogenase